jgi:hypothetical protein
MPAFGGEDSSTASQTYFKDMEIFEPISLSGGIIYYGTWIEDTFEKRQVRDGKGT